MAFPPKMADVIAAKAKVATELLDQWKAVALVIDASTDDVLKEAFAHDLSAQMRLLSEPGVTSKQLSDSRALLNRYTGA